MSFSLFTEDTGERSFSQKLGDGVLSTIRYWFSLDSHVYSMSISANVLLGFFPFMVLILSVSENLLGWSGAEKAIYIGLRGFLPEDPGLVSFVERNLAAAVTARGSEVEIVSIILLLFASNGIFMPLEVAQNRLWGFEHNRHYVFNQITSFCLTLVCGLLALSAALFASSNTAWIERLLGDSIRAPEAAVLVALKLVETPFFAVMLVLIYWLLPNGPVPFRRAAPTAAVVAVLLELGQLAYARAWPWLDLRTEYGPFFISITLLLWGFLAAMLILAGAQVCARGRGAAD